MLCWRCWFAGCVCNEFLPGLVLGACFMEVEMGVPFCAELGSIPDTGVPLREQRIAYEEPTPSTGGTAGRACRGGGSPERRAKCLTLLHSLAVRGAVAGAAAGMAGCSERRALLWPLVRVRVGQTRAGVRFPLTVSPAGD